LSSGEEKKEELWRFREVVADGMIGHARCTKRFVRNVRKNAMFLLSPAGIVRFIAGIVFQNAKKAATDKEIRHLSPPRRRE
jgi:hypothetical protein